MTLLARPPGIKTMKLAFIILSHSEPQQLLRLTRTLNANFDSPVVVCHHDFSQCPLDASPFPSNVTFVTPHHKTIYGRMSVVYAGLAAFALAHKQQPQPDWYYLLSGSDYPLIGGDQVQQVLANADCDAFIDYRRISYQDYGKAKAASGNDLVGFDRAGYLCLAYDRYIAKRIVIPHPKHPLHAPSLAQFHIRTPRFLTTSPLDKLNLSYYAGEHWFTANNRAVTANA